MAKGEPELKDMNYDPAVVARMNACKDMCAAYNRLMPSDEAARGALIRRILGRCGAWVNILPLFWCDFGGNIAVGENFFANHGLTILDGAPVTFGDNVFIGPDCGFYTAGHPLDAERRDMGLEYALPITVGNSVWFGGHVTVCPGVTIGDGAVVGAGAVVTRDVPPYTVVAGVPARVVRAIDREQRSGVSARADAEN